MCLVNKLWTKHSNSCRILDFVVCTLTVSSVVHGQWLWIIMLCFVNQNNYVTIILLFVVTKNVHMYMFVCGGSCPLSMHPSTCMIYTQCGLTHWSQHCFQPHNNLSHCTGFLSLIKSGWGSPLHFCLYSLLESSFFLLFLGELLYNKLLLHVNCVPIAIICYSLCLALQYTCS